MSDVLNELPLERESSLPPRSVPSAGQRVFVGLLIASGLQLFSVLGVFLFTAGDDDTTPRNIVAAQTFSVGMAFSILAMIGRRYPLFAAVAGLLIFLIGLIALNIVVPGTLISGFLVKLIILIVLARSLLSALEERSRT